MKFKEDFLVEEILLISEGRQKSILVLSRLTKPCGPSHTNRDLRLTDSTANLLYWHLSHCFWFTSQQRFFCLSAQLYLSGWPVNLSCHHQLRSLVTGKYVLVYIQIWIRELILVLPPPPPSFPPHFSLPPHLIFFC